MLVSCEAHRDTLAHQYILYIPMEAAKENGAGVEVEPWGMADAISQEISTMEDRCRKDYHSELQFPYK